MKKILVLMLVLGMTSMASAALTFSVDTVTILTGATTVVGIESDVAGFAWTGYVGYAPGNAELTGMVATAAAGPDATVTNDPFGYAGYYKIEALDYTPPSDILAGVQFNGTITGHTEGTYNVYLMSPWSAPGLQDTLLVNVIPEPMTLGLLGLGGLFLRRRK